MSGHSKWHNIQKTKGAQDAKRSAAFTKIAKEMIVAVKEGGSADPANNSRLATVITKAKAANMPNDNIKRVLEKASGAGSVRHHFDKYGGNLGANGCVAWSFDKKGVLVIDNEEEELEEDVVMMDAMDCGADDFEAEENCFTIYTDPDDFNTVADAMTAKKYTFVSAQIEMVPQNYQKLETEEHIKLMEKLIDIMEDDDDVQNLWHNWEE